MSIKQPDCVFIDDEAFIRESWEVSCRMGGKHAFVFDSATKLLEAAQSLAKDVPIFLDVDLRDDISGEELARHLHGLGFAKLYYATDHDPAFLERPKWLSGIVGKEVPSWFLSGYAGPKAS